jgi:hypothetical protein
MTIPIALSCPRPLCQPATFSTERLPLAIYLHATQRLSFLCCEATEGGKIRFVFEDSSDSGSQTELEYETRCGGVGNGPLCFTEIPSPPYERSS